MPAQSELSAKHFFGGREKMVQLQTDFAKQVGEEYGLDRGKHRTIGDERVTHTTLKEWYVTMGKQKKEIEALRVDLEASWVKMEEVRRSLDVERVNLVKERQQLERDIAGHADDLEHLERISRGQANIKAGLDHRENTVKDKESALVERGQALDHREVFLDHKRKEITAGINEINDLYRKAKVDIVGAAKELLDKEVARKAKREKEGMGR